MPMSINDNVNFNAPQPIPSMKHKSISKSKSTSGTEEKVSSSLFKSQSPIAVNQLSLYLDANYRPYHDALLLIPKMHTMLSAAYLVRAKARVLNQLGAGRPVVSPNVDPISLSHPTIKVIADNR